MEKNTEKALKKANRTLARTEKIFKKLVAFMQTKSGELFAKDYASHRFTLGELIRKYHLDYLRVEGKPPKQETMLRVAIEKGGRLSFLKPNIVDYTKIAEAEDAYDEKREKFVAEYQKTKSDIRLPRYWQKILNKRDEWKIARNPNGSFVIKSEPDDNPNNLAKKKLLFDKETGVPIFVWKKRHKGMGLALKLHMLEEHKMKKYDKKAAILEERDAKMDLFPDTIREKYKMLREARVEQIRKDLIDLYCPVPIAVMLKDKEDNVKRIDNFAKIRLKNMRSEQVHCEKPLSSQVTQSLKIVLSNAERQNPEAEVTCLKLGTHCKRTNDMIVFPERLKIAA